MFIADLHIHSKYARATSKDCVPECLAQWARRKGLGLIGTGDFTHPAWRAELREKLTPAQDGLYALKDTCALDADVAQPAPQPRFVISGEISCIYKKSGRVRKVHNLVLLPSLDAADALCARLEAIGNIHSDGRPILGLDSHDLLEMTLDACPQAVFIPAHIWTPHFSLFGAYSGFDTVMECFGDLAGHIHALETGLSSDPPMNWRLSALDGYTLVSNSDAHSPANLAREANIFHTELNYPAMARALAHPEEGGFGGTLEFFPEEGKYHLDGHRVCKLCTTPAQTRAAGGVCPVCGGRITVGVLHRIEALADRPEGFRLPDAAPYESLVPLREVMAACMALNPASARVGAAYDALLRALGPELFILREAPLEDVSRQAGPLVAEGLRRLRTGQVDAQPGYDGVYGRISVMARHEVATLAGQLTLLTGQESLGVRAAPSPAAGAPAQVTSSLIAPDCPPDGLNAAQWQAVRATDPALAVVAGPGTGKTHTLVSRIVHLMANGVPPQGIAAVTFTNKAASEMRARLAARLGESAAASMTVGTFHAICLRALAASDPQTPITVLGEAAGLALLTDALQALGSQFSPRDALATISLRKSGVLAVPSLPQEVYDAYEAQLAQCGALDYDDILLRALALAEQDEPKAPIGGHLLVDEFQDINPVQYRLIRAWAARRDGVFVIGDPDQAIYGFRGSYPQCFERFLADFSGAQQVRLTRNYRSTPEILRCAQAVLHRPEEQEEPLQAQRESGAAVRLLDVPDAFAEGIFVAKEINRLVGGVDMLAAHAAFQGPGKKKKTSGEPARGFSDIAVLYRTNRQAEVLEQCLAKEGIPYKVAGRGSYLQEPQARHALAFLRLLINPGDWVSLRLCLREDGHTAKAIAKIATAHRAQPAAIETLCALLDQIPAPARLERPPLSALLRALAPRRDAEKPARLLEDWMRATALDAVPCLELLLHTAIMYDTLPALLHNLALGREADVLRSGARTYAVDAVTLMTLHAAKGLEYPVVFLCGANAGLIPFQPRQGDANIAEERRLCYVGMTRAKDALLLLTGPTPSPFLALLPQDATAREKTAPRRPSAKQISLF
ncbi:MAG: UvrD-helicase domain-containing protein [Oscillospiraceae bacterium]|jgi:uncharacterized protein (TIGR00375 family)|nr:UvrD-helicase domain-containing protein [Oscillospiraceae bacterium]